MDLVGYVPGLRGVGGLGFHARQVCRGVEVVEHEAEPTRSAAHSGVTVHTGTGAPVTVAHTDPRTLVIDHRQYDADEGPCLYAMRSGALVRVDVATSREQWPVFAAAAEDAGVRSFLAAPFGTGVTALGALNLYSGSADGFGRE